MANFQRDLVRVEDLVAYLVQEYEVSDVRAKEICTKHKDFIQTCVDRASYISWVGDQIADKEGLEPKELDDEDVAYNEDE